MAQEDEQGFDDPGTERWRFTTTTRPSAQMYAPPAGSLQMHAALALVANSEFYHMGRDTIPHVLYDMVEEISGLTMHEQLWLCPSCFSNEKCSYYARIFAGEYGPRCKDPDCMRQIWFDEESAEFMCYRCNEEIRNTYAYAISGPPYWGGEPVPKNPKYCRDCSNEFTIDGNLSSIATVSEFYHIDMQILRDNVTALGLGYTEELERVIVPVRMHDRYVEMIRGLVSDKNVEKIDPFYIE